MLPRTEPNPPTTTPLARVFPLLGAGALAALSPLATPALTAQEGTITYSHSVRLDFELPPELAEMAAQFPKANTSTKVLHFGPAGSLMVEGETPRDAALAKNMAVSVKSAAGAASVMTLPPEFMMEMLGDVKVMVGMASGIGAVQNVYEDYGSGARVETHEFLGRTFRVADERPTYSWQVTTEQAMHLGYPVMKATTEHDSTTVEAWFTPAIPLPGGPASYGGLPGMILVLSIDDGHTQYEATEVALQELEEGLVSPPDEGREVTREEFEKIVADKLEELDMIKGPRRISIIGNGGVWR